MCVRERRFLKIKLTINMQSNSNCTGSAGPHLECLVAAMIWCPVNAREARRIGDHFTKEYACLSLVKLQWTISVLDHYIGPGGQS